MFPYGAHIQKTIEQSAGLIRDVMIIHKLHGHFFADNLVAGFILASEIEEDDPFWTIDRSADFASYWKVVPKDIPNAEGLSDEDRLRISRLIYLHNMIIPEKYPTVGYLDSNDGNYELHLEWDIPCPLTIPQHLNAAWSREIPLDEDSNEKPLAELMHEISQPVMLTRRMPATRVEAFGKNVKLIVTGLSLTFIQGFSLYQNYIESKETTPQPI